MMKQPTDNMATNLRKRIFLTGLRGGKAHLASAFSIVEILMALYINGAMRHDPNNPKWDDRDTLILSKGHGSLALYAVLCEAGYIGEEELKTFSQPGTKLGGEPVIGAPGIEATTGSLGHGLSLGVGEALAYKLDGKSNRVFVILGDGECEEGSIWEAAMSASRYGLDNLTVILDDNRIQKMGPVSDVMGITNWEPIWSSFGWRTWEVDGHDVDAVDACLKSSFAEDGRPHVLIAHTEKGRGVSLMEGSSSWHWRLPKKKEMKVFMEELGITQEEIDSCKKRI